MSDNSPIEWTDATWNPITGCTKVSPGCDNCYALTLAERFRGTPGHYFEHGFDVQLRPDKLDQPLRWTKPRRIFVNSMSDLFHDQVPDDYIARVWAVMMAAEQHTFQVLTKRHGRMRSLLNDRDFWASTWQWCVEMIGEQRAEALWGGREDVPWPLPNVWLGVSVENQKWADIRIPALLDTPAAVRFLSCEPLLGPVDLWGPVDQHGGRPKLTYWLDGRPHWVTDEGGDPGRPTSSMAIGPSIDWVIVGGESGHGARPMHPDWARTLRDQCAHSGVPFHFKQWGEWQNGSHDPRSQRGADHIILRDGRHIAAHEYQHSDLVRGRTEDRIGACFISRVGKKAAGRELDGRTWDEYPQAATEGTRV